MEDLKRVVLSGKAIPVRGNDIDTDRIIPARYLKCITFDGLGAHAFEDDRSLLAARGQTHAIDQPKFQDATIMLVNKNFGCGSSREHAPQAIMRWGKGINAIVGESFAEIFFGNCVTLGVPCVVVEEGAIQQLMDAVETDANCSVTLDLEKMTISAGSLSFPCQLGEGPRTAFLKGTWDSTADLLAAKPQIIETAARLPYFKGW
jgi:3-isopropylmalate/(R)-2-methylmalate dehydratase small subunit